MKLRILILSIAMAAAVVTWRAAHAQQKAEPAPGGEEQTSAGGLTISSTAFGHQYREDDWPAIAAAPDGSMWGAWLSFDGDRDDVAIRRYADGGWSNIHWVPNTSGDSWMPQVAVDTVESRLGGLDRTAGRQLGHLRPALRCGAKQEWGELERLTSNPLPDINPRLASNGKGKFALVWQGFRGRNSNIFLKTFDGERWSAETRDHAARRPTTGSRRWPSTARAAAWMAYDSYRDRQLRCVPLRARGRASQETGGRDAALGSAGNGRRGRPADRVWVAWEDGRAELGQG